MTSIRWRFIIVYISVVIITFAIVTIAVGRIIQDSFLTLRISGTQTQLNNITTRIAPYLDSLNADEMYSLIIEEGKDLGGRILVVQKTGIVVMDSFAELNGNFLSHNEVLEVISGKKDTSYGYHLLNENSMWTVYYSKAIIYNSEIIGAIVFSQSIQDIVQETTNINLQFYVVYAVAIGIIVIATVVFTRHITKPINKLTQAAGEISKGNFPEKVEIHGNNEIADLGEAFNIMTEKLQNVDKHRGEFVSNASHELKTPLASMKILVESILYQEGVNEEVYKEFLFDINDEIDRLTELINDLLLMTKIENTELELEEIYLNKLILRIIDTLMPIANTKGVEINAELSETTVLCDTSRIYQAIYNLVENAIKYTEKEGHVKVMLTEEDANAVVTVIDDGAGIEATDVPHIFERFYRVDKARSRETGGTGLGLHIVKRIALLHKGSVVVYSEVGKGSEFIFTIPKNYIKNKEG